MAATSLRTIQTLSTTSGQAWTVARTTTAASPVAHSHLNLYNNTPNPATNNPATPVITDPAPAHTASLNHPTASSTPPPASPSLLNTSTPTTTITTSSSPATSPATTTTHFTHHPRSATINQYQSINSHNQYIYNHHLQLSHNHTQAQQQQRRALQLQSHAHAQQRQQPAHHHHYQQQQQHPRQQPHNQQHQFHTYAQQTTPRGFNNQDQVFSANNTNNNNNHNINNSNNSTRQPPRQNTMLHPRAPLHYRSASPPAGAGSAIQVSATNPFRVNVPVQGPAQGQVQGQGQRRSPPPIPNRRRSASIRVAPPTLPIQRLPPIIPPSTGVSAAAFVAAPRKSPTLSHTSTTPPLPHPPLVKSAIRFDPFADESDVLEGAGYRAPSPPHHSQASAMQSQQHPNVPYTIHIPAAGTHEIQQYALRNQLGGHTGNQLGGHRLNGPRRSPSPPNPIARPVSPPKSASVDISITRASIQGAPTPQSSPTRSDMGGNPFGVAGSFSVSRDISAPVENALFSSSSLQPSSLQSSPSSSQPSQPELVTPLQPDLVTPAPVRISSTPRPARPQPTPNLSRLVAGILLNRVYAVGKPMRRNPRCGDEGLGMGESNGAGAGVGGAGGAGVIGNGNGIGRVGGSGLRWEVSV